MIYNDVTIGRYNDWHDIGRCDWQRVLAFVISITDQLFMYAWVSVFLSVQRWRLVCVDGDGLLYFRRMSWIVKAAMLLVFSSYVESVFELWISTHVISKPLQCSWLRHHSIGRCQMVDGRCR